MFMFDMKKKPEINDINSSQLKYDSMRIRPSYKLTYTTKYPKTKTTNNKTKQCQANRNELLKERQIFNVVFLLESKWNLAFSEIQK